MTTLLISEHDAYNGAVTQLVGIASGSGKVKSYVDAVAAGLSATPAVVVVMTTNVAALTGEQTLDGVLTSASRVLLTAQTTNIPNGIYVTGAGAWTRATDMAAASGASGKFVLVEQGTVGKGSAWVCTTASGSDVVGVNALTFTEFDFGGITTALIITKLASAAGAIAINGQKITGEAAGTATGDGVIFDQLADATGGGAGVYPGAVSGTAHSHVLAGSRNRYGFRCDFIAPTSASIVGATLYEGAGMEPNWIGTNANAASGVGLQNGNGTTEIGVVALNTGAQTNGSCTMSTWSSATVGPMITMTSANPFYMGWKVATPTASTDADAFVVRVGLFDTLNAAPANGIWFEWDAHPTGGDVHILTKTATGGTPTTVQTTGVTAGTGYQIVEIFKPAGSTTLTFKIAGAAQSNTGTCPTANPIGPAAMITKSAGTNNRAMNVDWADYDHGWATARA